MSDEFSEQARADFQRARFKAFINRVMGALSGQPSMLLSYDDIKEKLHIGGPIYRGVQTVRVDQIAGSLNRYHEFDRVFLPAKLRKMNLPEVLEARRVEKDLHRVRLSTLARPVVHDGDPRLNGAHEQFRIRAGLPMT